MSLVCGSGALSLCISKAFHRRSPQKETRATKDIPQQPACHMSPVETRLGRKQREASLHDHLNRTSELIPSDAGATVIRKHLGKRASAAASQQPEGSGVKALSVGLLFSSGCSLLQEKLCSVFHSSLRFCSPGCTARGPNKLSRIKATLLHVLLERHVTERAAQVPGPLTRDKCVLSPRPSTLVTIAAGTLGKRGIAPAAAGAAPCPSRAAPSHT